MSRRLFQPKAWPLNTARMAPKSWSISSYGLGEALDLHRQRGLAGQAQGLGQQRALRARHVRLADRAHDVHQQALRLMVTEARGDELEEEMGGRVRSAVPDEVPGRDERRLRGARIA